MEFNYYTEDPVIVLAILGVCLAIAVGLGFLGRSMMLKKGRSGGAGFALGFFLQLIGIVICAVMSESPERQMQRMQVMQRGGFPGATSQGFPPPAYPGATGQGFPGASSQGFPMPPQPFPGGPAPTPVTPAAICKSCGAALVPGAPFCASCGTKV